MLTEQIREADTNIDPMTVVAKGAALYASRQSVSEETREVSNDDAKIHSEDDCRLKTDRLKSKLIKIYANHPEILQERFKILFSELFLISQNVKKSDDDIKRLTDIENEINRLV